MNNKRMTHPGGGCADQLGADRLLSHRRLLPAHRAPRAPARRAAVPTAGALPAAASLRTWWTWHGESRKGGGHER